MSKSWNKEELETASKAMKAAGHMSYEEFCEALSKGECKMKTTNKYWIYLENLRRSGITNMYGAAPYLMDKFAISRKEATEILADWMKNYNPEDYK